MGGGDRSARAASSQSGNGGITVADLGAIAVGLAIGIAIGVVFAVFDAFSGPSGTPAPPNVSIACTDICKRLVACLESNEYDINKCPCYFEMVKDCQKN